MRQILLLSLIILAACTPEPPASYPLENIQIARDQWGVPHIIAPTDAEVAYGFGWAQCEDNFVVLQEQMLAVRGHLGEVNGKAGIVADFGIKFMGLREVVDSRFRTDLSPGFRDYLAHYVDGINNYAALHPEEVLLQKLFPLQPQDVVMGYLLGLVDLSQAGGDLQAILNGELEKEQTSEQPTGSNAIAISADRTRDGKTYLAINSHQPLEGWYSWYEAHLISEEGLNILGGTFPGGATIFHGANEYLGWAHTVNYLDLSDVYRLEMHPENPLQYRYDNNWLTLEEVTYRAKVKLFGPVKFPVKRKIYRSVYGPTFETEDGFYAWRFSAGLDIRAIEQWYRMNKARSFAEFREALTMQAIPCTNIVYADREDNIYFLSNARVPVRDTAYDWREVVPGNTAETRWEAYYPLDSLPQVLNPEAGYVFNTNQTPFVATAPGQNPPESPANRTMSFQHPDMVNSRSLRFQELIRQYDSLSYGDFKRIKYDLQYGSRIQSRVVMNLDLLFHLDTAARPDLAAAILQLKNWDRRFDVENRGAPFFIYTYELLRDILRSADRLCWRCTMTEEQAYRALERAQTYFQERYGGLEVPLGDFQRHIRGDNSLPLPGGPGVLAAMHSDRLPDGTYKGKSGESYIELVRFGPEGVGIETVHAYGSSARPESPHYDDQMEMFVRQELKPMTLDRDAVLAQARDIYAPRKAGRRE